jgi:SAM-dependent methyltransferase
VAERSLPTSAFDQAYAGTPPWDVPGPQPAFVPLVDAGRITGKVLDVGCGTGELALFLAARGLGVLGIDGSTIAINKAQVKAEKRKLAARFMVWDATAVAALGETFDTVVDSGLLHCLSDKDRAALVSGLVQALRPGGRYHLLCFNERASRDVGPRCLTQDDLRSIFSSDVWRVESIIESHFEVAEGFDTWGQPPPDGSTAAWLACIRRT